MFVSLFVYLVVTGMKARFAPQWYVRCDEGSPAMARDHPITVSKSMAVGVQYLPQQKRTSSILKTTTNSNSLKLITKYCTVK